MGKQFKRPPKKRTPSSGKVEGKPQINDQLKIPQKGTKLAKTNEEAPQEEFEVTDNTTYGITKKALDKSGAFADDFKAAARNGFARAVGQSGIKKLQGNRGFELKILGQGGGYRLYGAKRQDGLIVFNRFGKHL